MRKLREQRGLSQPELAKALNTTQNQISRYETGKRYPTDHFLAKIVEFFGSNSSFLHGEIEYAGTLPDDADKLLDAADRNDPNAVNEILRNRARQIREKRRNVTRVDPQVTGDSSNGT